MPPIPTTTPVGDFEASDAHLRKGIGLWGLIALAVSAQVGSGWLLATLAAASRTGPAAVLSWVIGAAFFGIIGVAWMELGTMLPRSGGGVRYPRLTHGALASWLNGWGYVIAFIALPVIEVQAVLTYVGGHWPGLGLLQKQQGTTLLAWPNGTISGFGLLVVFFVLNGLGAQLLSESNKYVTIWKLVIPTATFAMMFTAFNSSNFSAFGGFAPHGIGAIFGAVTGGGIAFAYGSVRQIVDFGGEVKNPQRNIPIAMIVGGLLIPLVLYVLLQLGFIGAIDWAAAGLRTGDWSGLINSHWASAPLLDAVTVAGFGWFASLLLVDAAVSPAASGWVYMGIAGRSVYSMSVNGELPQGLQRISRFGVPLRALALCTVVGFFMFLPVPSWYQFVGMVTTAQMVNYLIGAPTMAVFRRFAPQLPRPVFVKGAKFWGPAGYVASLLLIYFAGWTTLINVMTMVILALPIYASYTSVRHGWSPAGVSRIMSAVFAVVWLVVGWRGGWLLSVTGHQAVGGWPFPPYFATIVVSVVAFLAVLWLISSGDGRVHLRSAAWILPTLLATALISYLGDFGPLTTPLLKDGLDIAVIVAIALLSYVWAVRSGHATAELQEIIRNSSQRPTTTDNTRSSAS
jgi:amino acid transporter